MRLKSHDRTALICGVVINEAFAEVVPPGCNVGAPLHKGIRMHKTLCLKEDALIFTNNQTFNDKNQHINLRLALKLIPSGDNLGTQLENHIQVRQKQRTTIIPLF